MAAGAPADPGSVSVRVDELGGRVVRLGAVRVVWRGASGGDVGCLPAAGALASGRALARPQRRLGRCRLYAFVARRRPAAGHLRDVLSRPGHGQRVDDGPRHCATNPGGPVPDPARSTGTDVCALCDHSGFRRLLAPPSVAYVSLVVVVALAASCAAADDVLVGRPQPCTG